MVNQSMMNSYSLPLQRLVRGFMRGGRCTYSRMAVSTTGSTFNVATFNLLAPCHKRLTKKQASRWLRREIDIPELFTKRTGEILELVKSAGPLDIVCLQEFSTDDRIVDMFHDALGAKYNLLQLPRPGTEEGLAMFIDKSIHIVKTVTQDLPGMSCRVALHALLQVPTIKTKVLISTTHLEYQYHYLSEKIRQAQVKEILSCTEKIRSEYLLGKDSPFFLMGDFNGSPDSGTYSLLNEAGFLSAHLKVHGLEPPVTHKDHKGNEFTADYVFYSSQCAHAKPVVVNVHPLQYGTMKWPPEFTASDHRLLTAQFGLDQEILQDDRGDVVAAVETGWAHERRQNHVLCSLL